MKTSLFLLFFLVSPLVSFAQKEANKWYIGAGHTGLDFSSGVPVVLNDNAIDNPVINRNSCISDSNGSLLFYSDGENVWNRFHQKMPNGIGLEGDYRAWQSSIIVPNPADKDIYYLFTLGWRGGKLHYSVIDMKADNGKGDVVIKNVFLSDTMTEKIASVRHSNGKDYWVVTHKFNSADFYSYLVTENGVISTPVISTSGSVHTGYHLVCPSCPNTDGVMKISPDGQKLALSFVNGILDSTQDSISYVELFRFLNGSGQVIFRTKLLKLPKENTPNANEHSCGDLEFSPEGSKLYIPITYKPFYKPHQSELFQYDIAACMESEIRNSVISIAVTPHNSSNFFGIQLAPDGKIYLPTADNTGWGVINKPHLSGSGCDFQKSDLNFISGSTRALPNFISSFFRRKYELVTYTNACVGDSIYFFLKDTFRVDSVKWYFYDQNYVLMDSSIQLYPAYLYDNSGEYDVRIFVHYSYKCSLDTSFQIQVVDPPDPFSARDTLICMGDTLHLNVSSSGEFFLWQDGSTLPEFAVSEMDTVSVEVTNKTCISKDTIIVNFKPLPAINLGNDTTICEGDVLTLNVFQPGYSYLWKDGSVQPDYHVSYPDTIWIEVTLDDCKAHDSVIVNYIVPPFISLGADTVLCTGELLSLEVQADSASYIWDDGSSLAYRQVISTDTAWVKVMNTCGQDQDSVIVRFIEPPVISLGSDTVLCYHDSLLIILPENYVYTWNDSDQGNKYVVASSGVYTVEAKNKCGTTISTKRVENISCCDPSVPNLLTGNKDGLNEILKISCIEDGGWKLEIFNRWGERIFMTEDYKNDFNASGLEEGVYFYNLTKSGRGLYNGWIHVVK